jgi:hypothetical protein
LDEEKSKCASLAQENGFGSAYNWTVYGVASTKALQRCCKCRKREKESVINMI